MYFSHIEDNNPDIEVKFLAKTIYGKTEEETRKIIEQYGFVIVDESHEFFFEVTHPEGWTEKYGDSSGTYTVISNSKGEERLWQSFNYYKPIGESPVLLHPISLYDSKTKGAQRKIMRLRSGMGSNYVNFIYGFLRDDDNDDFDIPLREIDTSEIEMSSFPKINAKARAFEAIDSLDKIGTKEESLSELDCIDHIFGAINDGELRASDIGLTDARLDDIRTRLDEIHAQLEDERRLKKIDSIKEHLDYLRNKNFEASDSTSDFEVALDKICQGLANGLCSLELLGTSVGEISFFHFKLSARRNIVNMDQHRHDELGRFFRENLLRDMKLGNVKPEDIAPSADFFQSCIESVD